MVRACWSSYQFIGTPSFILACKLKALKQDLKKWNLEVFGHIDNHKSILLEELEELEGKELLGDISEEVLLRKDMTVKRGKKLVALPIHTGRINYSLIALLILLFLYFPNLQLYNSYYVGDLLALLNVSSHEKILPTTYGELRPPLGKHRLKIVEFIAVLLKTANDAAENELVSTGTIRRVIDLFFEYPYNNSLHHHVESIVFSCLDSKNDSIANHLLRECNLIGKILQTDKESILSGDSNQPTIPAAGKRAPRVGNIGHIRRISNKLVQLGNSQSHIQAGLQVGYRKIVNGVNGKLLFCMSAMWLKTYSDGLVGMISSAMHVLNLCILF
ncbi:hypothetical protein F2P56_011201 [Juglans regia]|uniref:Uncharacterized protein n=1 Tax=Juglans regia TaxID=51240 RepID=A0A833XT26_JUGRE|nr:hypothetical protein F2P56_011201 [Juglans regia]